MRLPYNDPANNGQSFSRVAKLVARAFSRFGGASFGRSNSAAKRCFQRAYFGGEYAPQMSPPMIRRKFAQFSKRPLKIGHREATALPVRHRLFDAQAIEIDRDVDIFVGETFRKFFKTLAPILAQNCAPSVVDLSMADRLPTDGLQEFRRVRRDDYRKSGAATNIRNCRSPKHSQAVHLEVPMRGSPIRRRPILAGRTSQSGWLSNETRTIGSATERNRSAVK